MKLKLIFIVMEVFTILAYPFVFIYGKFQQFSKFRERIRLANLLVTDPVTPNG